MQVRLGPHGREVADACRRFRAEDRADECRHLLVGALTVPTVARRRDSLACLFRFEQPNEAGREGEERHQGPVLARVVHLLDRARDRPPEGRWAAQLGALFHSELN